ncbi:hypothetical protein DERF_006132 [Dermatophagoides farinae]|uniref:Uncharacterized protein n=1 Tax=Dermatophagoides farinae TaxID=6954 RepID=A0A922I785_DERFA|nr:hypothetical protein DERF_006132 [Dermatophagoides farinae]
MLNVISTLLSVVFNKPKFLGGCKISLIIRLIFRYHQNFLTFLEKKKNNSKNRSFREKFLSTSTNCDICDVRKYLCHIVIFMG